MALAVIKTCTKVGLAGGAIYWTVQQGVWGEPQEGADAMRRLMTTISPSDEGSSSNIKVHKAVMPVHSEEGLISSNWNKGIKTVFECVRDIPQLTDQASTSVKNLIQDTFKS